MWVVNFGGNDNIPFPPMRILGRKVYYGKLEHNMHDRDMFSFPLPLQAMNRSLFLPGMSIIAMLTVLDIRSTLVITRTHI